jgi:hypothetical protein
MVHLLFLMLVSTPSDAKKGGTGTSIALWIVAGAVVILGMQRLPLIPDRLWRFICWAVAAVLGLYAAARIHLIPSGRIWLTWAFALIVVLALAFWIERLLEQLGDREAKTAKERWGPTFAPQTSVTTLAPSQANDIPTDASQAPIFEEAPRELMGMSPAALADLFKGRTGLQQRKLIEQHLGKEVRVSGEVKTIEGSALRQATLGQANGFHVQLFFDNADYDADPMLSVLNKGDEVSVYGQIFGMGEVSIALDRCRDIEVRSPERKK